MQGVETIGIMFVLTHTCMEGLKINVLVRILDVDYSHKRRKEQLRMWKIKRKNGKT